MSTLIRLVVPSLLSLAMAGGAAAQSSTTVPQGAGSPPAATGGASTDQAPANVAPSESKPEAAAPAGDILAEQQEGHLLSSDLVGMTLVNEEGKDLGEISDLIMDEQHQVIGAIVEVGGFLGLGSKSIGLPWQALRVEEREGSTVAVIGMTEEQLAEAPEFKSLAQIEAERAAQQPAPSGPVTSPTQSQ